ncbi:hypothetical protein PQR02_25440 [Paraburkholderia sediminicola]|uniref:Uncharacterized protein n=1 Tax=Paraburkholderia rhynchosiae TaxID=487049 RepID=A0ACC7NFH5_9BURK
METFIDREIAHLARVMRPSLVGGPCGPILPVQYWRWRLHRLLDVPHLTRAQLCALDSLLLQLGTFEASCTNRPSVTSETAIWAIPHQKPGRSTSLG